MIRKSGWLVFLVFVLAVFALVYLFAGFALRLGMIYTFEKAAGAEVNIGKVTLSLAPLALNIHDLQVTDLNRPTHNSVSFARAQAALEVWPALLGYYVVNDLSLDKLEFGSERASPGKVYRGESANADEQIDLSDVLRLDIPDAEELLSRVDLQSIEKGKALREQIAQQKRQLEELKSKLPKQENLQQIQTQVNALKESKIDGPADLATKADQLRTLQESLQRERENVQQAKDTLVQMRAGLEKSVAELRAAAEMDMQRLKELANIGESGLAPISQIILGDFWGEKIASLETVYRFAKPYMPKSAAADGSVAADQSVVLPNRILPLPNQPYPDFWIKNARLHWIIGGGEAVIQAQNITAQHDIINSPTQFQLDVDQLPKLASFRLQGDFAIFEEMITNLTWDLRGLELASVNLGGEQSRLQLTDGLLAFEGSLKLVNNEISQQAEMLLQKPVFSAEDNQYLEQLAGLLNKQEQIPLKIAASGVLQDPDVSIRSPLDKLIGSALLGEARDKLEQLESKLRSQVDAELQAQLGDQPEWLETLGKQEADLDSMQAQIQEMLDAKLQGAAAGAKDRIKETLLKRRESE